MRNLRNLFWPGSAVAIVALVMFVLSQGSGTPAQSAPVILDDEVFPRVKIISLGNTVGRFDTSTGEISRFHGQLTGATAQGTWVRYARPVTQTTSGFLDLRKIGGGTFLVDLDTGETWILRRDGGLGTWRRINVLGS